MNAYELADQLDNVKYQNGAKPFEMYANMLRQQADRIAELEKVSKPVAWIDYLEHSDLYDLNVSGRGIPLYTAPQIKELSDDEIHQIFRDESGFEIDTCPIAILDFARAILKKASEK